MKLLFFSLTKNKINIENMATPKLSEYLPIEFGIKISFILFDIKWNFFSKLF